MPNKNFESLIRIFKRAKKEVEAKTKTKIRWRQLSEKTNYDLAVVWKVFANQIPCPLPLALKLATFFKLDKKEILWEWLELAYPEIDIEELRM